MTATLPFSVVPIEALGSVGPAAKSAVPALITLLMNGDTASLFSALSLGRIGGRDAVAAIAALSRNEGEVREW